MGCCQSFDQVSSLMMTGKQDKNLLSEHDIEMIKFNWTLMQNFGLKSCGVKFMVRIFTEHPHLKSIWKFAKDLKTVEEYQESLAVQAHGDKVFAAVNMAVNHLTDFDALIPILIRLGYKHHSYGAREEHMPVIGNALISTLAEVIESDFTDEMRHTWNKLYKNIEVYMIIGMRQAGQISENKNPSIASMTSDRKQSLTIYNTPLESEVIATSSQTTEASGATSTEIKPLESESESYDNNTPLTGDDVTALRDSWTKVREKGLSTFGTNMMIILFTRYPTVKSVWSFSKDLNSETDVREHPAVKIHGDRLFAAINMTIGRLKDLDSLKSVLSELGANHYKYGARMQHFPFVAQALFDTLEGGLQPEDFGESVRDSWIKYLKVIEENMAVGMKKALHENERRMSRPTFTAIPPADIKKIRECWIFVVRGGLMYFGTDMMKRLFTDYKEIKSVWKFSEDLDTEDQIIFDPRVRRHGDRLFTSLDLLIGKLEDQAGSQAMLQQLGFKHYLYGARPEHFQYIANALLDTLANGLKNFLDEQRKAAWLRLFDFIKEQMIIGMIQAENESRKF